MWKTLLVCCLCLGGSAATTCGSATFKLEACLDGLQQSVIDRSRFWFGTRFKARCPNPMEYYTNMECQTNFMGVPKTVQELTGIDPADIRVFLNVTYTSQPGEYTGCDHVYKKATPTTHVIDPLSDDVISAWELRSRPEVTWDAVEGKAYTLMVVDVATNVFHGLFMNIQGNDVTGSTIVKPYHGPLNPLPRSNLYTFLLYEQEEANQTISALVREQVYAYGMNAFKVSNISRDLKLKGPVGISHVLAKYDRYSVTQMSQRGIINNCLPFVKEALKEHERPFIPSTDDLDTFVRVEFTVEPLEFTYCCQQHAYTERSFFLDPTGSGQEKAGETREGSGLGVFLKKNMLFPNATTDYAGKQFSLLVADPDVPYPAAGSTERPLLHGLSLNRLVDPVSGRLLEQPDAELANYRGPLPPNPEPHNYYFLLFEQPSVLALNSTLAYAGEDCVERLRGRCLFDVKRFAKDHQLKLVGLSWMTSQNDAFVNHTRGVDEETACPGKLPCAPASGADARNLSTGTLCLIGVVMALRWLDLA